MIDRASSDWSINFVDKKTTRHIINYLRQATITWPLRNEALRKASKKVKEGLLKNGKEKVKTYWTCAICKEEFRDISKMEVDHIVEIGPFNGSWDHYIPRMFCDISNLQVLCVSCHLKKTSGGNASLKFKRKT